MEEQRPRIRGIVGFGLVVGVVTIISSISSLNTVNDNPGLYPDWLKPLLYFGFVLGVGAIAAALLISRYKRVGLYIGLVVWGIDLISRIVIVISPDVEPTAFIWLGALLNIIILYYLFKYLTQEPQKTFFT